MSVRDMLNKLPFWIAFPFISLIFYLSVLLYVVLSPLIFLYGLLLCPMVWIEWAKEGKDVLVVYTDSEHSKEWAARLSPLIGHRAVLLDYSECDRWDRSSLSVQLFEIFGPKAMPELFRKYTLPSAIVFKLLRRPKTFSFGERSQHCEERLEALCAELRDGV